MTTAGAPGETRVSLTTIGQIAVRATDLDRAVTFYRDTLGARFLFRVPNLAFFQFGDVRMMLSPAEKPELDHPSSIIYYKVDDIDGVYRTLEGLGVQFVDEPHLIAKMPNHDLWMVFFKDSEGNTLGLMCEKRERGSGE